MPSVYEAVSRVVLPATAVSSRLSPLGRKSVRGRAVGVASELPDGGSSAQGSDSVGLLKWIARNRAWRASALAFALVVLAAMTAAPASARTVPTGTLRISITGLPRGQAAAVVITGRHFRRSS